MAADTYYTVTGDGDYLGVSPNGDYHLVDRRNAHDRYVRNDGVFDLIHGVSVWEIAAVDTPTGGWESETAARPVEGDYTGGGDATGTATVARVGPMITDNFERAVDPGAEPAPWDSCLEWAGGTATTETDAKYTGTYGLHLGNSGVGDAGALSLATSGESELYVGAYVRVTQQAESWLFKDRTAFGMFQLVTVDGTGDKFKLKVGSIKDSGQWAWSDDSAEEYDLNTWLGFVELYLKVSDGSDNGGMKMWIDGIEILSRMGVDNDEQNFDLFGPHVRYGGSGEQAADYDHVQIDTSRIYPPRGFKIYHNSGVGPIDYDTVRDTYASNVTDWTSDVLAYPNTWRFGVRAYNEYGEEKNVDVAEELVLLASGEESPARPNRPVGVAAAAAEGGKVEVTFSYDATGEVAACTHFHVCYDAGSGEIDYASPLGAIDKDDAPLTHYAFLSDALDDGQAYRFAVRAATADDVEDDSIEFVEVTADAQAPTQPESLTGVVVR